RRHRHRGARRRAVSPARSRASLPTSAHVIQVQDCGTGGGSMQRTVLICDDAIFMRTVLGDILREAGFDIVGEAETGREAVVKYRELEPDLVTMDIVMPDMGG